MRRSPFHSAKKSRRGDSGGFFDVSCACISGRGDRASWWLIQDLDKRLARMHLTAPETPDVILGVVAAHGYAPEYFFGALECETALPFDFIQARYSQDELWRAYVTMLRRLDESSDQQ